jgi:hypothetical protein
VKTSPSFEIKQNNTVKTLQPIQTRKASERLLYVTREFSKTPSTPLPNDVPLSFNHVAKDLVRAFVSGEKADKDFDGRHVEIVGEHGERIKVIGRTPSMDPNGGYYITFVDEAYTLGFAKPKDRPDSVFVVFYNKVTKSVDLFSIPVDPAGKKALPTKSIRFSSVKQSYCSSEKYLVSSTPTV